jgi:hypothetical protein
VQSKRIFLTNNIVLLYTQVHYPYDCGEGTALHIARFGLTVEDLLIYPPITNIPTSAVYSNGIIIGFKYDAIPCVDCTIRGTKTVPAFWK